MLREEAIYELEDAKDGYAEYLSIDAINIAIEALKQPEIITCGECKHASTDATCCLVCNREGMGLRPYHVHSDDYCSYAERRSNGQKTGS